MKKTFLYFSAGIIFILAFVLSACGEQGSGTYYPDKAEMTQNMQTKGYTTYSTNWLVGEGTGIFFSAERGDDYIKVYWLDDAADCEVCYHELEESYSACEVLVQIQNDEKWGNIVYCGTSAAVEDSGIRIVKVNVNVKV